MESLDIKIEKYRNNIKVRELTDARKTYFDTKDKKIRENLIFKYMPKIKKIISNSENITIEKEDLEQIAYEVLINCIDNYNPYRKEDFSYYLDRRVYLIIKKYSAESKRIDLLDVESNLSNDDTEDYIINKIFNEELINIIETIVENYPYKKHSEIFKKIHGINCEIIEKAELARKLNVTYQYIEEIDRKLLLHIYLNLPKEIRYYPSKKLEKIITNPGPRYLHRFSKKLKTKLEQININEMEYITFDSSYITTNNDNSIKKFGHK